jgi:nucleoside-diphosphate-sugar epimerase
MSTFVVTGAAGFVGSHLTDRLLAAGHEVLGVDSFEDYYRRDLKESNIAGARDCPRFSLVEANILALSADGRLAELMAEADCVYHLAAQAGVRASWGATFRTYSDNNVLATQCVLEAALAADRRPVVYASSSSVYGDSTELPLQEGAVCRPLSPYGVTKLAAENLCRLYTTNFGLHTVSLRFFTVYGPRQRPDMAFHKFMRAMLAGEAIDVYGDGSQTRDFTYVADTVTALVAAPQALAGSVINVGGGSRVPLLDTIRMIEDAMGLSADVRVLPAEAGDVRDTWADLTKAHDLLEYSPRVAAPEGLAAEAAWVRELYAGSVSQ